MSETYDISDFQKEVIEESYRLPVVVDFWAAWCQPCRILGPVLEKLAKDNKGKFKLAKVDTEKHTDIAREYRISGIPAVKLIVKGEVKAEFAGALPKHHIEKWLEQNIPSEGQKELEELKREMEIGFNKSIRQRLAHLIYDDENLHEARILLARNILFEEPENALELMKPVYEDSPFFQVAESLRTISYILSLKENDIEDGSSKELIQKALNAVHNQDFDTALDLLIKIVMVDKSYMDEIGRKACVAIFLYLGADHELSKKYRRRFDMSLY